jgi:hypothetical protein
MQLIVVPLRRREVLLWMLLASSSEVQLDRPLGGTHIEPQRVTSRGLAAPLSNFACREKVSFGIDYNDWVQQSRLLPEGGESNHRNVDFKQKAG